MTTDCLFCKIASGEIPSEEVYSDDEFYAFRDINPAAPKHVLVIPREHISKITDAVDEGLLGRMILKANQIAAQEHLTAEGFRYVINCDKAGGQEVFHIHLHILGGRSMQWPPG